MHLRPTLYVLILAVTGGCSHPSDAPENTTAPPRANSTPKSEMATVEPIVDTPTLTEDSLQAFEKKHSCQLPDDYRRFLLEHNGAFPSLDCVTFDETGRKTASDVLCFFAISDGRAWASLDWHHETFFGRLPTNTLPIARDSCGNLWLLSLRSTDAGSIFFWDPGSFNTFDETDLDNWPKVATSFQEFRDNLSTFDAAAEDGGLPSRYSLAKQAANGMALRSSGFTTRANPEFVWHCVCDEEGHVSMEFVQYEIHAVLIHTCGYSHLRAIKGAIKAGQPRLPP